MRLGLRLKWTDYIPYQPYPKQLAFLLLPHREAFFGGAAGGGKSDALLMAALQYALPLDTLIPNPYGFLRMEDIQVGDTVFDEQGQPTKVTAVTPPMLQHDCYELEFNNGDKIVADAGHKWAAHDFCDRMSLPRKHIPYQIVSTGYIAETVRTAHKKPSSNWSIPVARAIELPHTNLPVDPYVLGAWLGDGSKRDGTMAGLDTEVSEQFELAGYKIKQYSRCVWHVGRLRTDLGRLGVLNNKHIPLEYLRGSIEQRLALLQGLMDTDGTANKKYGGCSFFNTNPRIIEGILELLNSLGFLPFVSSQRYVTAIGKKVKYGQLVCFNADVPVFRIPRKINRQNLARKPYRFIVAAKKVETVPVRCITIDAPSKLFLAGKGFVPTHNCDVPGYSALIIRKTFKDLSQPGALISRSHEWLFDTPAKWNNTDHTWTFQTHIPGMPATLSFGYLSSFQDKFKYQGSEFQFVGVDEATHVSEEDYCYVGFTRCRKPRCGQHPTNPDPQCETCRKRQLLSKVPLRTRAASNPPSIGQGEWVKLRFDVKEVDGIYRGCHPKRAYIPSFVQDNPALDPEEYADSLSNVDPVTRAQLLKGDWGAKTEGRFKPSWFRGRTWVRSGGTWNVGSKGLSTSAHVLEDSSYLTGRFIGPGAASKRDAGRHFPESYHTSEILWFVMTDPAASYREGPGDKQIWRREPSWTVFGLFGLTPKGDLLVTDVARFQREIPDVIRGLHGFIRRCVKNGTPPQFIGIEANGVGKGVYQQCQRDGLPVVDCTRHTHDKFIYATPAMNRAAYGQIYLPAQSTPWLDAFTSELYGYTGHPQVDTGDQVDVLAHAAQYAHSRSVMGEQVWPTDVADMVGNF